MSRYLMRLDDASEYMCIEKWKLMEELLDKYTIKPIFGIIPDNQDSELKKYGKNDEFWELVQSWIDKGWIPAMHGYQHRYVTDQGGINPVNRQSEFAGLPYKEQAEKIRKGYRILVEQGIKPEIFFAPSHTFDTYTLEALRNETPIRIISDTISWDVYKDRGFWFIPQQSGRVRDIPFKTITFCYHPNIMDNDDFRNLDSFLAKYKGNFLDKLDIYGSGKKTCLDVFLSKTYFLWRNIRDVFR